jgi:hypothetical protein
MTCIDNGDLPLVLIGGTLCNARLWQPLLERLNVSAAICLTLAGDGSAEQASRRLLKVLPPRCLLAGWFLKDKKLAMMQTPHHFFSPDPFERNLGRFRKTPNEGTLFYGLVQDGNDMWDATFFCGSCAVIRRGPLDEIGGIAVETVTEDAHTSLRLHRRGHTSARYFSSSSSIHGSGLCPHSPAVPLPPM